MYITEENIKNHFITNPVWKSLFIKYFHKWNYKTYWKDCMTIFEKNGYSFKTIKPYNSERTHMIREVEIYKGKEFVMSMQSFDERDATEQLLIDIICHYEIDFSKFK